MGEGHPERPERLAAIEDKLIASRLDYVISRYEAPLATREQLLRVHDPDYVNRLTGLAPSAGLVQIDPDTAMNPYTLQAALRAAGAAVLGTDLVIRGEGAANSAKPSSRSGSRRWRGSSRRCSSSPQASTRIATTGWRFCACSNPTTPGSRPSSGKSRRSTPTDASFRCSRAATISTCSAAASRRASASSQSCSAAVAPPCSSARTSAFHRFAHEPHWHARCSRAPPEGG